MRALITLFFSLMATVFGFAQDASLTSSLSPTASGCMVGTSTEQVAVTITNIGLADIPTGCLAVNYSVNGVFQGRDTLRETVAPFTTSYFGFGNTVDLSLCGSYHIKVWVSSDCNINAFNDTIAWVYVNDCPNNVSTWLDGDTLRTDISGGADWFDCADDSFVGSTLDGAFYPPYMGTFKAVSTSTHCVDTTNCLNMATAGIEETGLLEGQALFHPNPSSEQVWLNEELGSSAIVELYSMEGRLIRRMGSNELQQGISLQGLDAGTYVLAVSQGDSRRQEVLVKR